MATEYECAAMSYYAYYENDAEIKTAIVNGPYILSDWSVVDEIKIDGFRAVAFKNNQEIVIAIRGTVDWHSHMTNFLLVMGEPLNHLLTARDFINRVLSNSNNITAENLILTGHSLGASKAQRLVYFLRNGCRGVLFDAPGINSQELSDEEKQYAENTSCVTIYQTSPHFINTLYTHFQVKNGAVKRLYVPVKRNWLDWYQVPFTSLSILLPGDRLRRPIARLFGTMTQILCVLELPNKTALVPVSLLLGLLSYLPAEFHFRGYNRSQKAAAYISDVANLIAVTLFWVHISRKKTPASALLTMATLVADALDPIFKLAFLYLIPHLFVEGEKKQKIIFLGFLLTYVGKNFILKEDPNSLKRNIKNTLYLYLSILKIVKNILKLKSSLPVQKENLGVIATILHWISENKRSDQIIDVKGFALIIAIKLVLELYRIWNFTANQQHQMENIVEAVRSPDYQIKTKTVTSWPGFHEHNRHMLFRVLVNSFIPVHVSASGLHQWGVFRPEAPWSEKAAETCSALLPNYHVSLLPQH